MTIKTENLVDITVMQRTGSLREALVICCQIDAAESQIKRVGESTYGRLRLEAHTVWNEMLDAVGGDPEALDLEAVRGAFEARLTAEEEWLRSDDCPFDYGEGKLPRKWIEAKSQIGIAIENGFDFNHDPEIGQSALRNFNRKERDRKDKEKQQNRLKKAAEAGQHVSDASKPSNEKGDGTEAPKDSGDLPSGVEGQEKNASAPKKVLEDNPDTGLTAEQVAFLAAAVAKMETIVKAKGPKGINGILKSLDNQLEQSIKSLDKAVAGLAKAG